MSATVQCLRCGRQAFARVIEDDPSTNAFECEPDWTDHETNSSQIDGKCYFYEDGDTECLLWHEICQHDEYEVLEVDYGESFFD